MRIPGCKKNKPLLFTFRVIMHEQQCYKTVVTDRPLDCTYYSCFIIPSLACVLIFLQQASLAFVKGENGRNAHPGEMKRWMTDAAS
jgi:hypothetical protein